MSIVQNDKIIIGGGCKGDFAVWKTNNSKDF